MCLLNVFKKPLTRYSFVTKPCNGIWSYTWESICLMMYDKQSMNMDQFDIYDFVTLNMNRKKYLFSDHFCISFEQDLVGNKWNILHVFTKQFYTSSRMGNTQKVKRVNKFRPKVEFNIFELLPRHPEYHMCHIYIIWISKYLGMLHMPCIEVWYIAYRFLKDERKITFMLEEDTSRW